ncbi:PREDICTED: uncharacterized protein LOC109157601 [Ipomoea nil]|uniref:uncharacterized protein LOC109157601 n=1 Tax=Ipomoea nil TaxID=35883 RepID=UPI000901156B|nr:PREDICTED: uncharacterized protein LOC109157601 [Ipomoea nil]
MHYFLQDLVEPHVSNDVQSSNHQSSMGQSGGRTNTLDLEVVSHQSMPPLNTTPQKAQPEPSQASIFLGKESFISQYTTFIAGLWSNICKKHNEIPSKRISSFQGSVERQLQEMGRDGVDLSTLKQRVAEFFKKAKDYDRVRSQLSNALSVETQAPKLVLTQGVHIEAQQKRSQTEALLLDQQKTLKDVADRKTLLEKTIKDAQEELKEIEAKNPELQDRLTKAQEQHNASQEDVTTAEEEVKRIRDCPTLTDEDEEKLTLIKRELEAYKEDLMSFRIV